MQQPKRSRVNAVPRHTSGAAGLISHHRGFRQILGVVRGARRTAPAGPPHPSLPHRRDGQRVDPPLQPQHGRGQEANQGTRAGAQSHQARPAAGRLLIGPPRRASRYGLRPARLPRRDQHSLTEVNDTAQHLHLSTADPLKVGFHPWLKIRSARWLRFGSAPTGDLLPPLAQLDQIARQRRQHSGSCSVCRHPRTANANTSTTGPDSKNIFVASEQHFLEVT